ncbi:nuclear transport factor 2 family protein [Actinopolymorpha sp. B11F2]|uniref:YybH family protein n=1 Tax=Actinopolymorpha sp. B11F2 TaxID=3160862 RepID=UPI0032E43D0D
MPTRRELDEAEIRAHYDTLIKGLRAKDLEALKSLYGADIVSFDIEPPLQHVGIEGKLKNWEGAFATFQSIDYEIRDLEITVGDEVAFAHSFSRLSGTLKNGQAISGVWVRYTGGLRKIDGQWLIVHDQVSVPTDFADGKALLDLEP